MQKLMRLSCLIVLAVSTYGWCQSDDLPPREDEEAKIQRLIRERKQREEGNLNEPTTEDNGASVNPVLLKGVSDTAFGLRYEERDVYFRMLELAVRTPLNLQERFVAEFQSERRLFHLEQARKYQGVDLDELPTPEERNRVRLSRAVQNAVHKQLKDFPTFHDIALYPKENRGHPVSIHGVLRKLTKFDPGKNTRGIKDVYEGWVFTDDSPGIPTVVVISLKPESLEVGGDLTEEVRVTGYFMKMYTYEGQDKPTRAPLILAGELLWHPQAKAYTPQPISREVYVAMTIVVLLGGYSLWRFQRRENATHLHPRIEPDFSDFPPKEVPVVHSVTDHEQKPVETNDS